MSTRENRITRHRENIRERIQFYIRMLLADLLILTVIGSGLANEFRKGVFDVATIIGWVLLAIGAAVAVFLIREILQEFKKMVEAT